MKIQTSRFGELEVDEAKLIELDAGMVGFPESRQFAWIAHRSSQQIAWLQSTGNKDLAFPLVNAANICAGYPDVPVERMAEQVGLEFENHETLALMVVLSAGPKTRPVVNLMAPVVINAETRKGAQVVLTNTRFTMAELPPPAPKAANQSREVG